tara:strand:+ start:48 stop:815 length:768 start_codon:yes stop_codon:yes gene_type:complete
VRKLLLILILPYSLFAQIISPISYGFKLQTSLVNYQNNTPDIYANNPYYNNISPSIGLVAETEPQFWLKEGNGAHILRFKIGGEILYNFFGPSINTEDYFPAFDGYLTADGTGGFNVTGAHDEYTLTNIEEAQNSLQVNLFVYCHIFKNLSLGISPYFHSVKNTSQLESWTNDMVVQSKADFSWQESGLHLSTSYDLLINYTIITLDLKFPLVSWTSSISGSHMEWSETYGIQEFLFNDDYLRKPLLFSITYFFF